MNTNKTLDQICGEIMSDRNEAIEKLTIQQFKEAIRQMIACGDFHRLVRIENGSEVAQSIVYHPYRMVNELQEQIKNLKSLIKEADDYLNTNHMTSIGHGSILHQKFKQATRGDEL